MNVIAFLLVLFCISGCAMTSDALVEQSESASQAQVARDFAQVLAKIPSLVPVQTTLSIVEADTDAAGFEKPLQAALVEEGYALRFVDEDNAANVVSYTVEYSSEPEPPPTSGSLVIYELYVDEVGLRQTYVSQADGKLLPVDTMQVRGMDPELLALEDELPAIGQGTPEAPVRDSDPAANSDRPDGLPMSRLSASTLNNYNYLHSGQSGHGPFFERTAVIDDLTVGFPDYSKLIGRQARQQIRTMMYQFDPSTDIVSIIANANGRGRFPGDQNDLARGRAEQVRKVIEALGVQPLKIFIEAGAGSEKQSDKFLQDVATVAIRRKNSIWQ